MSALTKLSNVKKLVVFIVSQVLLAVNDGFVPAQYVHYVQLTVFFLTAIGLYSVRNTPGEAPTAEEQALEAGLDILLPPKHEAPAPVGPITQPFPAIPPVPAG